MNDDLPPEQSRRVSYPLPPQRALDAYCVLAAVGVDAALLLDDANLARAVSVPRDQAARAAEAARRAGIVLDGG